jgi:hypothetical protein
MEMEKNKASGPYGFPTEFYQKIRQILNMTWWISLLNSNKSN